ncbi:MAG: penicillin-binding protein activator [Methyloligellaceae bacterium]
MTRRSWLAAAAALFLSACAGGNSTNLSTQSTQPLSTGNQTTGAVPKLAGKVKVALLLPRTSERSNIAAVAKGLKQSAELALFEFDNPNIVLINKDTKGTVEGAKIAATEALSEGAELIIGPLFASSVAAISPITRQANVPVIAFSSDEKVAGQGVYLLSFLAGRDVPRIVSYARSQGKQRFAALVPDTPYGQIVEAAFRRSVAQSGGEVLAVERYPQDPNGMLDPAQRISVLAQKDNPQIDALLIPGGPESLPSLSPLMPYFEIDTAQVQILGTGRWDYPNIGREKSLLNGWFPAAHPRGWQEFRQRYASTYGNVPPRISSLAYDAVSLALSLSTQSGQRYSARQITRASGFAGVDGLFRFLPDGTSQRGLAVLQVQKFGSSVIDGAPNSFNRVAQY